MNAQSQPSSESAVTRRQFIKTSSIVAASTAAAVNFPAILHAQNKQPIRAVIIGVGGRGGGAGRDFTEAVKGLGVDGKIVAVADLYAEQARRGTENFGVPAESWFTGILGDEELVEQIALRFGRMVALWRERKA